MEWLVICIILIFIPITFWLWNVYNYMKTDSRFCEPLPPGCFGIPIIGESISFFRKGSAFYDAKLKRYGNIYKTHLFGHPVIRVVGENNVSFILSGENEIVTSYWPKSTQLLLNGGLVLERSGPVHSLKKMAVLKALTHKALDRYIPTFVKICNVYINTWCQSQRVFIYPELRRLTFHVTSKTLAGFSLSPGDIGNSMNLFQDFVNGMFSLPVQFPFGSFRKASVARNKLLKKIESQLKSPENQSCPNILTFLQLLTEDGNLGREALKYICLDLLFASHETTSSAACFLILYLSKHRGVFCKLQKELKENGFLDNEEKLSFDSVNHLIYLNSVIKETIRLCCPVGAAYRKVLKTFRLGGYQIPKGWLLAYSLRETQETSEFFTSPREFDPDRWIDVEDTSRHFLCFGGGKRRCVGKDFSMLFLKLIIIEMMRSCDWSVENLSPDIINFPSPHPCDGMPVLFRRKQT